MPRGIFRKSIACVLAGLLAGCTHIAAPPPETPAATPAGAAWKVVEAAYGTDASQRLDVYTQPGLADAPMLLFVHGGGFASGSKSDVSTLPGFAQRHRFLLVSVGYRLGQGAGTQAQDVAAATSWMMDNAARYGADPKRLFLLGHSSGGNAVALVGVDPKYLAAYGKKPTDVAGVIGLDGAAYNAPSQFHSWFLVMQPALLASWVVAFGANPGDYSPTLLVHDDGHYPPFLLLYTGQPGFETYAREFADRLKKSGDTVNVVGSQYTAFVASHYQVVNNLGDPGNPDGDAVAQFIASGKP